MGHHKALNFIWIQSYLHWWTGRSFDFIKLYEEGIDLYFKQNWKQAIKTFQTALKIMDDNATHIFIARCQGFINNAPPKDWDGVWEVTTK